MKRCLLLAALASLGASEPVFQSPVVTSATPGYAVEIQADLGKSQRLFLVVTDAGDGFSCDWADWIDPKVSGPAGELSLVDVDWRKADAGWKQPQVNSNADGGPLKVAGQPVRGIGTHATSVIEYRLPEGYTVFTARGGLDDGGTNQNGGKSSSVRFEVYTQPPERKSLSPTVTEQHDLAEALDGLQTPDDLAITLFAGEPTLSNPTSIDIDARGRIWVCEVVNYRHFRNVDSPEREAGDRILILEDTNGDAKADKTTVFYQGRDIDSAHGICVLGERVIVSAGSQVLVFTDRDGDDKPDSKEVMFSGIGGVQHDHGIHAFQFGPDGKLYFNFGNEGKQLKDRNGNVVIDMAGNKVQADGNPYRQGMVFRCDLDGTNVETLGWNFRNNWEVTTDSFGTMWQSDNDDDGNRAVRINYVMPFGNYGYTDELTGAGWRTPRTGMETEIPLQHWHVNDPGTVPNVLMTGAGAPTGIVVYEGDLLPERFRGQIIHCDAGPNIVRAYLTKKDGAGYTATIENIVEGSGDKWFRPSDVCVAPDGSIFVADWYDPGVGGHRMEDVERGRIFRIAPKTMPPRNDDLGFLPPSLSWKGPLPTQYVRPDAAMFRKPIPLTTATALLGNPNLAMRYVGWKTLMDAVPNRQIGEIKAVLKPLSESKNPRLRARAIWFLAASGITTTEEFNVMPYVDDSDLQITALRAAELANAKSDLLKIYYGMLGTSAANLGPQTRREVAVLLRNAEIELQAPVVWSRLAQQHVAGDRWYLEALGIAGDGRWGEMLTYWMEGPGKNWNTPAGREIIWRSRSEQTPALLAKILNDPAVPEAELPKYLRAFDFQPAAAAIPVLEQLAFTKVADGDSRQQLIALEALRRLEKVDFVAHPEYRARLNEILNASRGTPAYIELVNRFGITERDAELLTLAAEHPAEQIGIAAMQSLLQRDRNKVISAALVGENNEFAGQVLQAIGNSASGRTVELLLPLINNEKVDSERRRTAIAALAKSRPGAQRLLSMAQDKKLDAALMPAVAAALHASADPSLASAVTKMFPLPPSKGNTTLPPIAVLASKRGDVFNGKLVFLEAGTCAKCHKVKGVGNDIGPDLTEIGSKLSREAMIESILYPSAGISHNYETWTALTIDGNVVTGLLVSQTADEIALKAADAITRTFPRSEIEELVKQDVSLMPADLQKVMTEQELVDVVEFLMTLKKPGG